MNYRLVESTVCELEDAFCESLKPLLLNMMEDIQEFCDRRNMKFVNEWGRYWFAPVKPDGEDYKASEMFFSSDDIKVGGDELGRILDTLEIEVSVYEKLGLALWNYTPSNEGSTT